jgi:envelope integrity protein B
MHRAPAALGWMLAAAAIAAVLPPVAARAQSGAIALAAHRAVYDLRLANARGKSPMQAVRGRILYDFSGSVCEGYALQFRQVSELDSGEGKVTVSDLRATSWEEGAAKRLRFHSQNFFDQQLRETVDGEAERDNDGVAVKLSQPDGKSFDLKTDLVFPTEHVRRIIAAAREGQTLLELTVYDGSDNGEKVFDTLAVIGRALAPDEHRPEDATASQQAFQSLKRWPVTISYFDRASKDSKEKSGEQTPVYAITFELYENGVSRALMLDYGDFVLSGELTSFEMKDVKPCP